MPRRARVVLPGVAYHVTHRGNRRQNIFFREEDRQEYKDWLLYFSLRYRLEIWAYCLMTNHVHLIALPQERDSLALTIGRTHGRVAQLRNEEHGWTGHLWANRYFSTPLDEDHLWAAVRYVERNPVRAGLVETAEVYPWSSARAHVTGELDPLLSPKRPFPGHVTSWSVFLSEDPDPKQLDLLRENTSSGRPTGSDAFVKRLERQLGHRLAPPNPNGRPPKQRK